MRSGGLSHRSEPLDHLQAAGSLSMHRELCAHSPTGAQSAQAIGMPGTPGEQGLWQWQSERQAGQWPGASSGLQLRRPDIAARQASGAQSHRLFLQAPDLAYTPKIEIFHCWNGNAPLASSDTTRRADHYGVLRYGRLQRVVSRLQVKVWSALAGGHRVSCLHPPWRGMELSSGHNLNRNAPDPG